MGIDACGVFFTKLDLTEEQLSKFSERLSECSFVGWDFKDRIPFIRMKENKFEINFDLQRYWGPGYERADFESVIAVLGWLRRQPEVEKVLYWGDYSDEEDAEEFDEIKEKEYVDHFFSRGYPYRLPYGHPSRGR